MGKQSEEKSVVIKLANECIHMFIIEPLSNDSTRIFGVVQKHQQSKKPSYTCRHYTKHFGIIVRARDWSPFGKIDLAV